MRPGKMLLGIALTVVAATDAVAQTPPIILRCSSTEPVPAGYPLDNGNYNILAIRSRGSCAPVADPQAAEVRF